MLLAIDIGNTNITLGAFEGDQLKSTWRLATDAHRQPDEYALQLKELLPMKDVTTDAIDGIGTSEWIRGTRGGTADHRPPTKYSPMASLTFSPARA